jgi:hypothetical protein
MSKDNYMADYLPAPITKNENQRLEAVKRTGAMYLDQDELYDVYCYLAKEITGCPVSWTGLIDSENQYCLASDGFPEGSSKKIPRKQTFCQYALDKTEPLIIQNMKTDLTFKNHPLVKEGIVKFYAAFPIVTSDGYTLGTLCVSSDKAVELTKNQIKSLKSLSRKMAYQLEIQENFRNKSAENLIQIINKISQYVENLEINNLKTILKFFSDQTIDDLEKNYLLNIKVIKKSDEKFEISDFGNKLKSELSLDKGILKRVKNLSNNENDLDNLFSEIRNN